MQVRLISVPYDSGRRAFRMGRGPGALMDWGLGDRISAAGHPVSLAELQGEEGDPTTSGFGLCGAVARQVRSAIQAGQFPLVLTGNCLLQLGVVAGIGATSTGVVWFDAHGDLNTPDTSVSGFLDGMALAAVTGHCLQEYARDVEGFTPVSTDRVALVGVRDLDPPELVMIERQAMLHVASATGEWRERVTRRLSPCDNVSVHLDLDALDPSVCSVNALQAADGLSEEDVGGLLSMLAIDGHVVALTVSAYDPAGDSEQRTPPVVERLITTLLEAVSGER